jgi:hypothetical protein
MLKTVFAPRRPLLILLLVSAPAAGCGDRNKLTYASAPAPPPQSAPVDGKPAFAGRWAPAASACLHDAWSMTTAGMNTPGELSCAFDRVQPTDAGYTVAAVCAVGKAKAPGRLVLTLSGKGPSRSLTVNGGPFSEPVALVRCPGEATPAQLQAASTSASSGG